ncbi:MAG: hypothetical protein K0R15_2446 [Clostridiales bacterium]|jgi:predicted membrane protein|nr:hypothetical protein [Clostridiales bacterium]
MRARISKMVVGIMIIGLGALLLAENYGYIENLKLERWWWTAFIIIPCFTSIIKYGVKVHNTVGLLIGLWLLIERIDLLPNDFADLAFWPMVLIVIGIIVIFGGFGTNTYHYEKTINIDRDNVTMNAPKGGVDINDRINYVAVFSSYAAKNSSQSLYGGEITAVFGGIEVDLSDANITRDIKIEVTGVFGNAIVKMPTNANIVVKRTAVLGKCSSNYSNSGPVNVPTIYVEATGVFGGVEII